MMLKLSTHSFPHRDKMQLWDRDETQAPTPTLSLPGQDGAQAHHPPLPHQDSMEPEDGEEAQAQHPPRREKAPGRGCWAAPSPPRQKGARGDAPGRLPGAGRMCRPQPCVTFTEGGGGKSRGCLR